MLYYYYFINYSSLKDTNYLLLSEYLYIYYLFVYVYIYIHDTQSAQISQK